MLTLVTYVVACVLCQEMGPPLCRGLRSEHSVVDQDLWSWYCQARRGGAKHVSKSLLQRHARLAFSKAGIYNFKKGTENFNEFSTAYSTRQQERMSGFSSPEGYATRQAHCPLPPLPHMRANKLPATGQGQAPPTRYKAETLTRASDGWYRRWINRWQKRCPAAINVLPRGTTPSSQPEVIDCGDVVSDVESKSRSAEICRSKDGGLEILHSEGTDSIENITLQSQFSGLKRENASQSPVAVPVEAGQPALPGTSLVMKKPASLNCVINELAKQNVSGSNNFVTSDKNFVGFDSNATSRELRPSNLELKSNEKQKLSKCVSEHHNEDEHSRNVNDDSLDIMDYLTLHITESCENSQFGNNSHCMSHSDTIDHILGSTTSDSFPCCSLLGDQQAQPTIDIGTYSEHLGIDHLREFASLVSQFAGSPTYSHKIPRSVPPCPGKLVVQDDDSISLSKNTPNSEKSQLATKSITVPVTTSDINLVSQMETSQTKLSTGEAVKPHVVSRGPVVPNFTQQDRKKKKKKKISSKHLKKGERYLPKFKKKVLAYAFTHTLKETARKFKVKSSTISAWKTDKTMMNSQDDQVYLIFILWKRQSKLEATRIAMVYLVFEYGSLRSPQGGLYGMTVVTCGWLQQVPSRQKLASREVTRPADWQFLAWLRRCREVDHEVTQQEVLQRAEHLAAQCSSKQEPLECSHWFIMWCERMKKQLAEDELELWVITDRAKEQHIKYPLAFKMEISKFADHYSQTKAAKVFNISRKRIFEWLNVFRKKQGVSEKETEPEVNQQRMGGRTAADVEVDLQIWEWYSKQAKKPSGQEVRQKGVELYQARGHTHMKCSHNWYRRWSKRHQVGGRHSGDELLLEWVLTQLEQGHTVSLANLQARALALLADTTTTPFKASLGWAIRFCKRYPELLYHYPTVESRLPQSLMTKVDEFRMFLQRIIQEKCVKLSAVGCMDEFHVNLSDLLSVNAESGSRRQLLRQPRLGNCHVTVVLACLADGVLLPPMVIAMVILWELQILLALVY
ncbi:hypothetical protein PR048_000383 [Dryococelus australis]|uniref:HTH CENPB-type domain-containing protein n=1 Tax=Dryococelus australis TaxID=614101 RepID=A0ABQ9IGR3_9NEOP|nr:hypothetical protein PR048_000383 [Dryococelus australis]